MVTQFPVLALSAAAVCAAPAGAGMLDLTHATVVVSWHRGVVERNACRLLVEEARARSGVRMRVAGAPPGTGAVIYVGTRANPPAGLPAAIRRSIDNRQSTIGNRSEGYRLHAAMVGGRVVVSAIGNDAPGCVFAAGRLLREMRLERGRIAARALDITTAPAKPLRGVHIGWGPRANNYASWDAATFEQQLRDMIVWGVNTVELVWNDLDVVPGEAPLTNARLASIAASYGVRVWLRCPMSDRTPDGMKGAGLVPGKTVCGSQPDGRRYLLQRRRAAFRNIRNLDAVFVPGGDSGGCTCDLCKPWPRAMLSVVADIARELHAAHPKAQLWISNQTFTAADNRWLYAYLRTQHPVWLTGLVYGPWTQESIASMRARAPARYAIRQFPDITHTIRCQLPMQDWDVALAQTIGREPPLYRLHEQTVLAKRFLRESCGAIPYTETVNDDLHRVVWASVLWDPRAEPIAIAHEYARYFLGAEHEAEGVRGILGLEKSWQGPLLANASVTRTLDLWRGLERGDPALAKNWRFQMALLTATYDRFVQMRLESETAAVERSLGILRGGRDLSKARDSVDEALDVLRAARSASTAPDLRARLWEIGQAMFDLVGMQLSAPRWSNPSPEHGAILDYLDAPISNLPWMESELRGLLSHENPATIAAGIARIVKWEDAGPGGFYDDLGNAAKQPHLVRTTSWERDPGYLLHPRTCFTVLPPDARMSWCDYAETLYGVPLVLRYTGLDPQAQYVVRAVYAGRYKPTMTLTANGRWQVHGPVKTPDAPAVLEWPVPRAATASGALSLRWGLVEGRGCQVSEVWVVRR